MDAEQIQFPKHDEKVSDCFCGTLIFCTEKRLNENTYIPVNVSCPLEKKSKRYNHNCT